MRKLAAMRWLIVSMRPAMAYDDFEFLLIELGEFGGAAASSDPLQLNFLHHLSTGDQGEQCRAADHVANQDRDEGLRDHGPDVEMSVRDQKECLDVAGYDMHEAARRDSRRFSCSVVSRRAAASGIPILQPTSGEFVERFQSQIIFPIYIWRNKMSNPDNQPGRDNRAGFDNRTPDQRTGLDSSTGVGTGTIAAIIAAVVIAGALMLFGPWGANRSAINNSTPTSSNSPPGTTTGQTPSGAPRVIAPAVAPAAPTTTAPAPNPQ
jgi:hypothetical protein